MKQRVFFKTSIPETERKIAGITDPELEMQMSLDTVLENVRQTVPWAGTLEDFPVVILNDQIHYDTHGSLSRDQIRKELGKYARSLENRQNLPYFAGQLEDWLWDIDSDENIFGDADPLERVRGILDEYAENGDPACQKIIDDIRKILKEEELTTIRLGDYDYNANVINIYYKGIYEYLDGARRFDPKPDVLYFLIVLPEISGDDILAAMQVVLADEIFHAIYSRYNPRFYDGSVTRYADRAKSLKAAFAGFYSYIFGISCEDPHYAYLDLKRRKYAENMARFWEKYRYSSLYDAKSWYLMRRVGISQVLEHYRSAGCLYKMQELCDLAVTRKTPAYRKLLMG